MKKRPTRRTPKTTQPKHSTGWALILCFVIAGIAVTLAARQLILESQYAQQNTVIDETSTRLIGTYRVEIPRGDTTRTVSLALESDRTATLIQRDQDTEVNPTVTRGSWSGDSNGTIIVSLQDKTYAFSYTPTGTGALRLLNPDVEVWGAATLTLTRD